MNTALLFTVRYLPTVGATVFTFLVPVPITAAAPFVLGEDPGSQGRTRRHARRGLHLSALAHLRPPPPHRPRYHHRFSAYHPLSSGEGAFKVSSLTSPLPATRQHRPALLWLGFSNVLVIESCAHVYCVDVWFGIITPALLLAVVFSQAGHSMTSCGGSWVSLGLFCLLRVTHLLRLPALQLLW